MSEKRYLWEIKLSYNAEPTRLMRFFTEEPDAAFIDLDRVKRIFSDENMLCDHVEQLVIDEIRRVTSAIVI